MIQIRYEIFDTEAFFGAGVAIAKRMGKIGCRLVIKEKDAAHPLEVMPEIMGRSRAEAVRRTRCVFGRDNTRFYRGAETVFIDARPRLLQRSAK